MSKLLKILNLEKGEGVGDSADMDENSEEDF